MILPIHPQPQEAEVLSSWMMRLACANSFKLHTFYSNLLEYKGPAWNRDIDRDPHPELLSVLVRSTGQSTEVLHSMTLHAYDGVLFEKLPPGNSNWLLPLGIYHRSRKRPGLQYCPMCLQEDASPYFRRRWRLSFYVICAKHRCILLDRCQRCSMPLAFHRNGIGRQISLLRDAICLCFGCGFDLRHASPRTLDKLDDMSWGILCQINSDAEFDAWNIGDLAHPLSFFDGLKNISSIVFGRYGHALRDAIGSALRIPGLNRIRLGSGYEFLEVEQRLIIMQVLSWLLVDWPERFITVGHDHLPAISQARDGRGVMPYWVEQAFAPRLIVDQH